MYAGSFVQHLIFLLLTLEDPCAYGNDNCTAITIQRGIKYSPVSGTPFSLECPVQYCQKKPQINWYKNNEIVQVSERLTVSWINKNLFVLNIPSLHKNDSGQYRCRGTVGKEKLESHEVEVVVQDHGNMTEPGGMKTPEKNKLLTIYLPLTAGALGFLVFCCFVVLCFIKQNQVKNKEIRSALQSEMNEFSDCASELDFSDSTTGASLKRCALYQEARPCVLSLPDGNTVCGNHSSQGKTTRFQPEHSYDKSVKNDCQPLPTKENLVVYATLNHEELSQKPESFVEMPLIEYAVIGSNNWMHKVAH